MPEALQAESAPALTVGTAGHIDHGKTALVGALTGTDTDRLAEERRRGISIELGFAELELPGRTVSVVDVPGHRRLVRAMVAGAGGIDLFLLVIAADDGVMPQTREHWTVLESLGIDAGVIALSKCDAAAAESRILAGAEAEELAPGTPIVEVSARTGLGLDELREALGAVAAQVEGRRGVSDGSWPPRPPVLHLDRAFTLRGIGTVGTGTLRSGALSAEQRVRLLPSERVARVRSLEVHGRPAETAGPGRRVAVNLAGIARNEVAAGDVVTTAESGLVSSYRLDVVLAFDAGTGDPRRVQVHHGTRDVPARAVRLADGLAQLRLEAPLVVEAGDRLVLRRIAPPCTIGGATVIDPLPSRHGAADIKAVAGLREALSGSPEEVLRRALGAVPAGLDGDPAGWGYTPLLGFALARFGEREWTGAVDELERSGALVRERGRIRVAPIGAGPEPATPAPPLDARAIALLRLLDSDGLQPRATAALADELGIARSEAESGLAELQAAGRIVRLRGDVAYPAARLERIVALVAVLARERGSISLAKLRDDLRISRKYSQAIIEHLDAAKVTIRHGDRHELRRPR